MLQNYPKFRHPGWNKGSVAYHADDGKIFVGSGIGDAFGPKCGRGDVMGCGILFPRDYVNETGASDVSRDSDASDEEERDAAWLRDVDPDALEASDSDDEFWMQGQEQVEEGKKVKVRVVLTDYLDVLVTLRSHCRCFSHATASELVTVKQ